MNTEDQPNSEQQDAARADLQAQNEELIVLNAQIQQEFTDQRRLTDDLRNLLSSTGIAGVFLDNHLNILRFNPVSRTLFNITVNDIGRPFGEVASMVDDPNLIADARQVLIDLQAIDRDVPNGAGKWFIRRVQPCRGRDGDIEGVVITFSDVTDLKKLQQKSKAAQHFAESIVETIRESVLVLDHNFTVIRTNRSFQKLFNTKPEDIEGKPLFGVHGQQWDQPGLRKVLNRVLSGTVSIKDYEITMNVANLGTRALLVNARQIENEADGANLILLAAEDVTERQKTQRDVEELKARLRAILDAAPQAIITIDARGIIGTFSPEATSILGYSAGEMIGQNVSILMPEEHRGQHDTYLSNYLETGERKVIGIGREAIARHKNGSDVPILLNIAEWWIEGNRHFTGILHDLTDEMKRREALQHAQKMEAVGQLTGGLAHDFNNLVTVIIGNLELLEMQLGESANPKLLSEALEAASLGAKLTGQLLAFSRKQALDPETVSLNDLVTSIKPLLSRSLGARISIESDLADDLRPTLADPGQIENAILNLALNARDAMPGGGKLIIGTRNATLGKDNAATLFDVAPGDYVTLSVTDTGFGMTPEVVERVFDPFFTTKSVGSGSGLGLSMVYGFAKQSGGHVVIDSKQGSGTTITLYLPSTEHAEKAIMRPVLQDTPKRGSETILVVEDDPRVRRLTVTRLQQLGYNILEAKNGPDAIELLRLNDGIDLVLSDIVMPGGMTGFEVAEQALAINPTLKILLATGYASGEIGGQAEARTKHIVLRKPYNLHELATNLRTLLR